MMKQKHKQKTNLCLFYPPMGSSPWTASPSHHEVLLLFLLLFSRKPLTSLSITFSSSPPCFLQLLLASNQLFESSTNSKQTFPTKKSQVAGKTLLWQESASSGKSRNPAEIHKNTIRSNTSMVIMMYRAKAHSPVGAEAAAANEWNPFSLSHGN